MDKIVMKGLSFYGYHGVFPEENSLGQKFIIDLFLYLDLNDAGQTDDLEKSVSYAAVFDTVKFVVEQERFKLLEALAAHVVERIFDTYPLIQGIDITVKKPNAPINGAFDYVAVELRRSRHA